MKNWQAVLMYGAALGLLLAALQVAHYRLLLVHQSVEWYIAIVAVLFTAVGIWAGSQRRRSQPETAAQPLPEQSVEIREKLARLGISAREYEVLSLMAQGLSNQEIADQLYLSLNTVKTHSSNLFAKLAVQRRTQAVQQARQLGII